MKFPVVVVAALSSIAATVVEAECKPFTNHCAPNGQEWYLCNTKGEWEVDGCCPDGTVCENPYARVIICTVRATRVAACPAPQCVSGTYRCVPSGDGWQVCNERGYWLFERRCKDGRRCKINPSSGEPSCEFVE
ncbi:hypothetical protein ISF_09184 [Cordyceps fumosorosea ARSEF 2679]|uniref:Uncharacterized protein n=1 Tax=Cordyceps fumosorosea (strain ARSEF 2679) TaxID=1081104 RepID=A0A167LC03_CORFA|nr:hypothetical protein ISF_09184 [Cordyceps fumosorosea ARSEF 2679]OAA52906.1 hypothetical protein ISF_09184 [Cordyceps fumosorosea ARSEF 2679]